MSIWRGEEKLWKVFWGGLFFEIVFGVVIGFAAAMFHLKSEMHAFFSGFGFVVLNFLYTATWAVLVWKCRRNSSSSAWDQCAALFCGVYCCFAEYRRLYGKINPPPLTSYNSVCIKALEDFARQNNIDPQQYIRSNQLYRAHVHQAEFPPIEPE